MKHYNSKDPNQHFFASCSYGWGTDATPHGAIQKMRIASGGIEKTKGMNAMLIHVPLPPEAQYTIDEYLPEVEGITKIWAGKL